MFYSNYSLLPDLKKLDEPVFVKNDEHLAEKQLAETTQKCFLEHKISNEIYDTVNNFISKETGVFGGFHEIMMQLQEDAIIHRLEGEKDWMAACSVCFPSGWNPEEKIGQDFNTIHQPIPGMNLKNSQKLVKTMIYHGPFLRYVWGLVYENKLNFHPSLPKKPFNRDQPEIYLKLEKQITYGFPEIHTALFVLRAEIIKEFDKKILATTLKSMSPEQGIYKDVNQEVINYLTSSCGCIV